MREYQKTKTEHQYLGNYENPTQRMDSRINRKSYPCGWIHYEIAIVFEHQERRPFWNFKRHSVGIVYKSPGSFDLICLKLSYYLYHKKMWQQSACIVSLQCVHWLNLVRIKKVYSSPSPSPFNYASARGPGAQVVAVPIRSATTRRKTP